MSRTWVVKEFLFHTHDNIPGDCFDDGPRNICDSSGKNHVSKKLLEQFLQELHSKGNESLKFLVNREYMDDLLEDFDQYHKSLAQFVLQFKQLLAHHFSKKGRSFHRLICRTVYIEKESVVTDRNIWSFSVFINCPLFIIRFFFGIGS
jgi:sRNA-binding regulator protein Hfq